MLQHQNRDTPNKCYLHKNRLSIGPRAGLNFATVDAESASRVTGLAAGITSTYSINEGSGVSVDLLYSAEGYEQGNTTYDLNYFKVQNQIG